MLKKLFLVGTALAVVGVMATNVWAFGGIGIGPLQRHKSKSGVDAIGVHIDGKGQADIEILDPCPDGLERNTDGTCTVCANGNVYLSYMSEKQGIGPCDTETPMQGNCVSNKDCESDEYCDLNNTEEDMIPNIGTCISLNEGQDKNYLGQNFLMGTYSGEHWGYSWWSTENWCRAHGKEMVAFEDLSIPEEFPWSPEEDTCVALFNAFGSFSTRIKNNGDGGANVSSESSCMGWGDNPSGGVEEALCK